VASVAGHKVRPGRAVYSATRHVAFAIGQPEDIDIDEILFRPTAQEY
jgi:NADP-dependent 3-hydroxy acid dehydrogenase YdfG